MKLLTLVSALKMLPVFLTLLLMFLARVGKVSCNLSKAALLGASLASLEILLSSNACVTADVAVLCLFWLVSMPQC